MVAEEKHTEAQRRIEEHLTSLVLFKQYMHMVKQLLLLDSLRKCNCTECRQALQANLFDWLHSVLPEGTDFAVVLDYPDFDKVSAFGTQMTSQKLAERLRELADMIDDKNGGFSTELN